MDDHKGLQWARAAWTRRFRPWRQFLRRQHPPRRRPPRHWAKSANRVLSHVASAGLIVLLARQLAGITWTLIPGERIDAPAAAINPATLPRPPESSSPDIEVIAGAHLFGEYVEQAPEPAVPMLEAPETELDLLLKATVSEAHRDRLGAAVIAGAGSERTYTAGDEIEGTGGAMLHAIFSDRVILNFAGQFQTLRLPRNGAAQNGLSIVTATPGIAARGMAEPGIAAPNPTTPNPFASSSPTAPVSASTPTLNEMALRLSAVINAVPHVEQGVVVGFRVNPEHDPAPFEALGFKPGDVVTEINGTTLTDPGQALQAFERLGESAQANLVLIRDGAPRVLTVDTSVLAPSGIGP